MISIFEDRESAYPNRYRVIPESGDAYYVVLERADEPVTPGTPLNAETFNRMREEISNEINSITPGQIGAVPLRLMVSGLYLARNEEEIDSSIVSMFNHFEENGCIPHRLQVIQTSLSLKYGLWYVTPYKSGDDSGFVIAIKSYNYGADIMYRSLVDGEWQPWEWANPPMDLGVEYRTTERLMGKVVYTKLIYIGTGPNNTHKNVSAPGRVFRVQGYCELLNVPDISLPYYTADGSIHCGYDAGHIYVNSSFDASLYSVYAQVWYTKD